MLRDITLILGIGCGLLLGIPCPSGAQTAPTLSAPPQQMVVNGPTTESYPSTSTLHAPTSTLHAPSPTASDAALGFARPPAADAAASLPYDTALAGAGMAAPVSSGSVVPDPLYMPYGSPEAMAAAHSFEPERYIERTMGNEPWIWQLLPNGLMYPSYLAGNREPRFGSQWVHIRDEGWQWDATLGGRVGLVRYGTVNDFWPEGWQWDIEGAAFVRKNLEADRDVDDVDFRGCPVTTRQGPWEFKGGYYHYCSHLGDFYMVRNNTLSRVEYVRDSMLLGVAVYLGSSLRLYSEASWAFHEEGVAKPWEFQFGAEFEFHGTDRIERFSPFSPSTATCIRKPTSAAI